MIDIHCHLLPHLDDGAATMDESLEMARIAANQGIHTVIATPHHQNGKYENPADSVREAVRQLNDRLVSEGIPLQVLPGQEIRITSRLLDELEAGRLLPLGDTRYMLIELTDPFDLRSLTELVHELKVKDYVPVLAHPERHPDLNRHPEWFEKLMEQGVLGQVTTHSLTGRFGKPIQRTALRMCRSGMIHLMATDAHNPYLRSFDLLNAYREAEREIGTEYADLLRRNAEALLRNETVQGASQTRRLRKAWFF